jgi:hypothetical protein
MSDSEHQEQGGLTAEEKWDILTRPEKLGEILLKHGKLTVVQLEELIKEQETSGRPLGELILSKGLMSRTELLTALDWQHRADKVIIDSLTELINQPKKSDEH